VADDTDTGGDVQAQPASPSPQPVVYPTIGTEKVTENGKKPGSTTTRGGSGGGAGRSGS
jgi:hypothetical protein